MQLGAQAALHALSCKGSASAYSQSVSQLQQHTHSCGQALVTYLAHASKGAAQWQWNQHHLQLPPMAGYKPPNAACLLSGAGMQLTRITLPPACEQSTGVMKHSGKCTLPGSSRAVRPGSPVTRMNRSAVSCSLLLILQPSKLDCGVYLQVFRFVSSQWCCKI